eukprot:UN23379
MNCRGYYSTVSFIDEQLGRIIDHLKSKNLWNNTIVVFWGDHGYSLGEHGLWAKQTLFENAVRVPLILSVPGYRTG